MSKLKLNLIAVGVVVLLTAGFAFGFVVPGVRKLRGQRDRVAAEAAQVRADQRQLGNVSELYESIVELDKTMGDFRARLPEQRSFGDFLNSVSDNLKQAHVEGFSVHPKPAVELDESRLPPPLAIAKGTILLPVRISFDGTLAQVVDFQRRMEALPRLSHVESMKLTNDEDRPGVVRVDLLLITYCRPN